MSNNFPAVPNAFALASIVYSATFFPSPATNQGLPVSAQPPVAPAMSFTGVATTVTGISAFNLGSLVVFAFETPGSFGTFDQAAAEAQVSLLLSDCCQFLVDATGQALAAIQADVTVSRHWTWTDGAGNAISYADTMTYPPAA